MEDLSRLERAVLEKLLLGDQEALELLRRQLATAQVVHREMTGAGFLTRLVVSQSLPAADIPSKVYLGDVVAEVEGLRYGLGFILFIEHGRLALLEGYTHQENWPASLGRWRLKYDPPVRDLSALGAASDIAD